MRTKVCLFLCLLVAVQLSVRGQGDRRRTTFSLVGTVAHEDGKEVKETAEVILVCSGVVIQRVDTDSQGQFSFRLGDPKSMDTTNLDMAGSPSGEVFKSFNQLGRGLGDTGQYGSGRSKNGRLNLSDCELSARLPGYSSEIIYPGVLNAMESPDIGTIVLRPRNRQKASTVSVENLRVPEEAASIMQGVHQLLAQEKPDYEKALSSLEEAIELHPPYGEAWLELGKIHLTRGNLSKARLALETAVEKNPGFLAPYIKLTELSLQQGDRQEAARWSSRSIQLAPDSSRACYLHAYASFGIGELEIAEEYARQVQESEQASLFPGTHYLLGSVLAGRRDYVSAASEWRAFLELNPEFYDAERVQRKLRVWKKMGLLDTTSGSDGSD